MQLKKNFIGILCCSVIAMIATLIGKQYPIIGAPVIAIVIGMFSAPWIKRYTELQPGIKFTSKKILQYAVVLLGFSLNMNQVMRVGVMSLPIIVATISIALCVAFIAHRYFHVEKHIATLVGVGSSICGGSAIAATAPVIDSEDEQVTTAISVIFFYNVLAVLLFPTLGQMLQLSPDGFGLFVGTAVNDTSSVTATASIWDAIYRTTTLELATIVKLTRTLAIIPITFGLSFLQAKSKRKSTAFPTFIIFFLVASVLRTFLPNVGVSTAIFEPLKEVSKFFIVMAMSAIGLNTHIVKIWKTGKSALLLGGICWVSIILTSLILQQFIGLW